jgi:hypothetical protein
LSKIELTINHVFQEITKILDNQEVFLHVKNHTKTYLKLICIRLMNLIGNSLIKNQLKGVKIFAQKVKQYKINQEQNSRRLLLILKIKINNKTLMSMKDSCQKKLVKFILINQILFLKV